jgi:tetratricopeptide (TPR) repeat protein
MRRALVLGLLALATAVASAVPRAARAENLWSSIAKGDLRRQAMAVEEGNLHLREARERRSRLDPGAPMRIPAFDPARAALAAYERALTLGPEDPDIHYRALTAAKLVVDNGGVCHTCRDWYEAVVRHVEALRRLRPEDPRDIVYSWDMSVALSKLGGIGGPRADAYFERAVEEYARWRRLIDETDPTFTAEVATSYSNGAELLMALGPDRLDEAIAQYQMAVSLNPMESLHYFGLAVAYDRDGQWEKAVATMREGLSRLPGLTRLEHNDVFFVPEGDVYYYYALAHQVQGADPALVIAQYERFLSRTRATRYAQRAREHIAELRGADKTR